MRRLDQDYLRDDFKMDGDDMDEFMELCAEIDTHTKHVTKRLDLLETLSVKDCPENRARDAKELICYHMKPKDPINGGDMLSAEVPLDITGYLDKGFGRLLQETKTDNHLIFRESVTGDRYFVSNNAFNTLAQRIDCDGKTLSHNCVERDLFLSRRLDTDIEGTMVIKELADVKKVFAVMSKKYGPVPLEILSRITRHLSQSNCLGKPECLGWRISHMRAEIYIKFEEYADDVSTAYNLSKRLVPVVSLLSSDIGECSIIARGSWLTSQGDTVPDMEYVREHRGEIDSEQVLKEVQESVFDKFTVLPERLADLMGMDVTPDGCDLNTACGQAENRAAVYEAFQWIFRKLKIPDILGQRRFAELMECIDYSINEQKHYDLYDLVNQCFSLPSQLQYFLIQANLGDCMLQKLQKAFAEAPYLNFKERKKNDQTEAEEQRVFLTPAV